MNPLNNGPKLRLIVHSGERRPCDLCLVTRWCVAITIYLDTVPVLGGVRVCERCLRQIVRFISNPAMELFLLVSLADYGKAVVRAAEYERKKAEEREAEGQFGRKEQQWLDALLLLYRALANGQGPTGNVIPVVRALKGLTDLDVVRGKALVEKAWAEAKQTLPATVHLPLQDDPLASARRLTEDLLNLNPAMPAKKIPVIQIVRTYCRIGLKEAKDIVEEALARRQPMAASRTARRSRPREESERGSCVPTTVDHLACNRFREAAGPKRRRGKPNRMVRYCSEKSAGWSGASVLAPRGPYSRRREI